MADQIVSWGGFNSKGTSGMGVTGSFQVSSSANSFFVGGGSVGVGTTTPTYTLQVIGTSSIAANFGVGGSNDGTILIGNTVGDGLQLGRQYNNGQTYFNAVGNSTGGYSFRFAGAEKVAIDSSGNTTLSGTLRLAGNGSVQGLTNNSIYVPSGNGGASLIFRENTNGKKIAISSDSSGNTIFYNEQANSNFANSDISMYIVGSSKNVLIGTTTDSARLTVKGSGTTSSTTSLLVQNANASSSLSIKDNGDSTFFYPGVAGYSLKISGSYSGNGASAIYETLGATGGYYGIHEFRTGTNTANAVRAMSIVYGGRVVIGNKSDTVLQHPAANLFVDTNVINTFNNSTQAFNTGIIINPSGSLNTELTASGIQFNFAANNPNDTNGGAFVGSQYNPLTNGYDSDLVIYNSQGSAGSYVETARFVGKSKSLSLGAGRNPSASLHISGSSNSTLLEIDSPAVNNILFVSGSGNVGIGTSTPSASLHVAGYTIMSGSASTSSAALSIYKSGSTVLDIQGSSGQLFSVTDSLSGSLFSVNTVAGLPVIEAFSNNVVNIGKYGAYGLVVSGSDVAVATGSSAPTGTPQEGTFKFVASGGSYYIYAYIGGAWRSGSLA